MSELEIFDCPSCGGPLDPHHASKNLVKCPYCGKNVIVPESLREKEAQAQGAVVYIAPAHTPQAYPAEDTPGQTVRASRWVSCLVITILVVTVVGVAASIAGPLLAGWVMVDQVGSVLPTIENVMVTVPTVPAVPTIPPRPTPTPGIAEEMLGFGEEGTGPGMFDDTRWVAVDPDGSIYTAEYQDGRIQKFGPDGKFLTLWNIGSDVIIQDLAVSRQGVLYASAGGKILKFDTQSGAPLGELTKPGAQYFTSLAATPDGSLIAVDQGEDVVRFDASGQVTLEIPAAVSAITGDSELKSRVAVDGLGNIYLLGSFNYAVFVFSPEGKFTNRVGSKGNAVDTLNAPNDVAVDGKGRLYVSDIMGIKVFTTDGRFLGMIDVEGAPFGLALDDQNALYVASNAPRLSRFQMR